VVDGVLGASRVAGHDDGRCRYRSSVRVARGSWVDGQWSRRSSLPAPGAARYAANDAVRDRGFVGGCCLGSAEAHPAHAVDLNSIEANRSGEQPEAGAVERLVTCEAVGREEVLPICSRIQALPAQLVQTLFLRWPARSVVGDVGGDPRTRAGAVRGATRRGGREDEAAEACGARPREKGQLSVSPLADGARSERRYAAWAVGRGESQGACAVPGCAPTVDRVPEAVARPFYRRGKACERWTSGAVLPSDDGRGEGAPGYCGQLRAGRRGTRGGRGLRSTGREEALRSGTEALALPAVRSNQPMQPASLRCRRRRESMMGGHSAHERRLLAAHGRRLMGKPLGALRRAKR